MVVSWQDFNLNVINADILENNFYSLIKETIEYFKRSKLKKT